MARNGGGITKSRCGRRSASIKSPVRRRPAFDDGEGGSVTGIRPGAAKSFIARRRGFEGGGGGEDGELSRLSRAPPSKQGFNAGRGPGSRFHPGVRALTVVGFDPPRKPAARGAGAFHASGRPSFTVIPGKTSRRAGGRGAANRRGRTRMRSLIRSTSPASILIRP